jgi:hypothetical protein
MMMSIGPRQVFASLLMISYSQSTKGDNPRRSRRLKFIEQLYDGAIAPFEEIKRQIEEHEPSYVDEGNPEYVDEPAFLRE